MRIASQTALLLVTLFLGLPASAGGPSPGGSGGFNSGSNLSGRQLSGNGASASGQNSSGSTPGGSGSITAASDSSASARLTFTGTAGPGPAGALDLHSLLFKASAAAGPDVVVELGSRLRGSDDDNDRMRKLQAAASQQLTAEEPIVCW
jgi:hypothetical protein